MYGIPENPTLEFNAVRITGNEIVMKEIDTAEWKIAFTKDPAKVSTVVLHFNQHVLRF